MGWYIAVSSVSSWALFSEDPAAFYLAPRQRLRRLWQPRRIRCPVVLSGIGPHGGSASPVRATFISSARMARSGQAYTRPVRAAQAAAAAREDRPSLRK